MGKIIGIDLGTTNSAVAVMEGGKATIVTNSEGNRTTPSVVAFEKGNLNERKVGETAKRQAITNPDRTIISIKRDMGTAKKVKIDDKEFTPEEISAMILQKIKADTEQFLGEKVTEAVITVPAYFTDSQRQATKDAGRIAGLEVKRIINEPTAAALAYGFDKEGTDAKIMVYDLGGGTFDVSILEVADGVFEVLSTHGNNRLGGDDFDEAIINWLNEEFKKEYGVDLKKDPTTYQRLKDASEKAKKELSSATTTNINLPFITAVDGQPVHLIKDLSRAQFDDLTKDLVKKTEQPVLDALKDAGLSKNDIDKVLLVGGSTRIPAVQESVKRLVGKEPQKDINPDECVALGAAVQGGVLAGDVKGLLLLDVTSLSLGIETLGGITNVMIPRNTTIPTKKKQIYTTAADNQTEVDIHVLQGEREMASDNTTLGRFQLNGIPMAKRGVPQIEVEFDIDANGIVKVTAKDLGTGKEQNITITSSNNLTEEEIQKRIEEAEKYADEDKKKKERVEAKNEAEGLYFATKKLIEDDFKDSISEEDKKTLEDKMESLKSKYEKDITSDDDLKALKDEYTSALEVYGKIAEKLYKEQAAKAGNKSESSSDNTNTDYEVVDGDE